MKTLKKQSDYYNLHKPTWANFIRECGELGWFGHRCRPADVGTNERCNPTDLADVQRRGPYNHLLNGQPQGGNGTGVFKRGKRFAWLFKGSAMTYFGCAYSRVKGMK